MVETVDPTAPPGRLRHKFTDQVAYEATATGNACRRPIEWLRTLYRRDDLTGLLPLGELQSLAPARRELQARLHAGLLTAGLSAPSRRSAAEPLLPDPAAVLGGQAGDRGGYLRSQTLKADGRFPASDADDHWWIPSGQSFFTTDPADTPATELAHARQHFFLPRRYRDPFGQDAFVDFDANDLLMVGNPRRARQPRDGGRQRLPRPAAAPGQRPEPQPDRGRLRRARHGGRHRRHGQAAARTGGRRHADRLRRRPDARPARRASSTAAPTQHSHRLPATCWQDATTRIVYDLDRFRRTQQANPTIRPSGNPPAPRHSPARPTSATRCRRRA